MRTCAVVLLLAWRVGPPDGVERGRETRCQQAVRARWPVAAQAHRASCSRAREPKGEAAEFRLRRAAGRTPARRSAAGIGAVAVIDHPWESVAGILARRLERRRE